MNHGIDRHLGEHRHRIALGIHEEGPREDLLGEMRIEREGHVGDVVEIAIDPRSLACGILDCSTSALATDIQTPLREREILLIVDIENMKPESVRA